MFRSTGFLFSPTTLLLVAVILVGGSTNVRAIVPRTILAPYSESLFEIPQYAETLFVNDSRSITIKANEPYNFTHIKIKAGETYRFTVGSPGWNNGSWETDAGGYNEGAQAFVNVPPRHPDFNLMALTAEIFTVDGSRTSYSGTYFLIGLGPKTWKATRTGYLVAFANDCLQCYADNSRVVTLTIKRTA
jgi:hypothetical protein